MFFWILVRFYTFVLQQPPRKAEKFNNLKKSNWFIGAAVWWVLSKWRAGSVASRAICTSASIAVVRLRQSTACACLLHSSDWRTLLLVLEGISSLREFGSLVIIVFLELIHHVDRQAAEARDPGRPGVWTKGKSNASAIIVVLRWTRI